MQVKYGVLALGTVVVALETCAISRAAQGSLLSNPMLLRRGDHGSLPYLALDLSPCQAAPRARLRLRGEGFQPVGGAVRAGRRYVTEAWRLVRRPAAPKASQHDAICIRRGRHRLRRSSRFRRPEPRPSPPGRPPRAPRRDAWSGWIQPAR